MCFDSHLHSTNTSGTIFVLEAIFKVVKNTQNTCDGILLLTYVCNERIPTYKFGSKCFAMFAHLIGNANVDINSSLKCSWDLF